MVSGPSVTLVRITRFLDEGYCTPHVQDEARQVPAMPPKSRDSGRSSHHLLRTDLVYTVKMTIARTVGLLGCSSPPKQHPPLGFTIKFRSIVSTGLSQG